MNAMYHVPRPARFTSEALWKPSYSIIVATPWYVHRCANASAMKNTIDVIKTPRNDLIDQIDAKHRDG